MRRRSFLGLTAGAAVIGLAPILQARTSGPYTAGSPLLLNQNENSLGMSPLAIDAAKGALKLGHRYPDEQVEALAGEIALIEGLGARNIGISNGSTGMIEAVMRNQRDKNASIVAPSVTYGQARGLASKWGMSYKTVPMDADFKIDLAAMEAASLKIDGAVMIYLVSPNNPTGQLTPSSEIAAWIKRAPDNVFFLVDEAYHELVSDPLYESAALLVKAGYTNLVVARTFSKIYAMAGMRVGYGIAHTQVMDKIKHYYASWNVNVTALVAASAALKDHDFFRKSYAENQTTIQMVYKSMSGLGFRCIPSQGNFVLHQTGMDIKAYQRAMFERFILVGRDMGTGRTWNRLSMGTVSEMAYFLEQFRRLHS